MVFIYAGVPKLLDPQAFGRSVSAYDLVPEAALPVVAYGLPALEIVAGIGLIFNIAGSLTTIFGMLLFFVIILWYGILHDLDIDCGCFSTQELAVHDSLRQAFRRDLLMIAGLIYVYIWRFVASRSRTRERLSLQEEEADVQR